MLEKQLPINKFKERALSWAYKGTLNQEDDMCRFVSGLSKVHHEMEALQSGQHQKEDHPHHTPEELCEQQILLIKEIALLMKEIKTGASPETVESVLRKELVLA